jgi:hypothetical protein
LIFNIPESKALLLSIGLFSKHHKGRNGGVQSTAKSKHILTTQPEKLTAMKTNEALRLQYFNYDNDFENAPSTTIGPFGILVARRISTIASFR